MFDSPGNSAGRQGRSVGLSVGATNLAATYDGHAHVRAAEVTVHGQRLTGFVDRVGDPVPLVAPDGSSHRPEVLLAEALGATAQSLTGGEPVADMAVTVPAHWRPSVVDALRRTLHRGIPVVSDATAALTALSAGPGLPTRGVIVLCDFGGSGTTITLANASSNYAVVGDPVRFTDFSGDQIDRALLGHVVSGMSAADDPSGTAMVGSLTALRDECRRAKERLSAQTAAGLQVELPGRRTEVRVTRTELDDLTGPLITDFLATLDDTLERYGIPAAGVSAVATVGGGARIPLVTQRLSEHLRAPVVTTAQPHLTAAEGAAVVAQRSRVIDLATTITPAPAMTAATTALATDQPSTTMAALAWSDDPAKDEAELPYSGPEVRFRAEDPIEDERVPRRAPILLFALSATAVALTAAVFGVMQLTGGTTPVEAATTVAPSPVPAAPAPSPAIPAPQATHVTTVVVKPVQRASVLPRPQAPVSTQQTPPPAPPPPPPPPTTTDPPWPPVWTPPTWTPPTWTPPWQIPASPPSVPPSSPPSEPPPSEPSANSPSGAGGTDAGTADAGPSGSSEPPASASGKGSEP